MNDPDRDDLSGIEPLEVEDTEDITKELISITDTETDVTMEKYTGNTVDYNSSVNSKLDSSDATLTSGYVSRSFPSVTNLSKSLPVSPDREKQGSLTKHSAIHRSAGPTGTDKENAERYRRPAGMGARVQLFPESGELRRSTSENINVERVIKRPNKSISRSVSSPPPGALDSTGVCYFSRDKFFQLTPEVEPLITNDPNNNKNDSILKTLTSQNNNNPVNPQTTIDGKVSSNADESTNLILPNQVPPLSIEQLVNISTVSEADLGIDNGILNQSSESLNFQLDSDALPGYSQENGNGAGISDELMPRSLFKDDDCLMNELVIGQAFQQSPKSDSFCDDDLLRPCQMPPMDLQPVVYHDLDGDKTFTDSPNTSTMKTLELSSLSVSKQRDTSITKSDDAVRKSVEIQLQERIPGKEQENKSIPQHLEKNHKERITSMATSQISNEANSEHLRSFHGPGVDPTATHDLSISSSIYSYLGKASRPQEIARDAANLKTSSPMVNRAQVQEFLQKESKEIEDIEPFRDHLRKMLQLSENVLQDKNAYDHSENDLLFGNHHDDDHFTLLSDFSVPRAKNSSFVPNYMENLGMGSGFLFDAPSRNDVSNSSTMFVENQTLKETLEKERFRRKHVEKRITVCQSQILELQEQLAVAVSMGRKKDAMIEQLDKALAKVVNGWRRKDAESKELVQRLQQENDSLNTRGQHQQEMAAKFEKDLSTVVEKLRQEQQRAAQVEEQNAKQLQQQQEKAEQTLQRLKQVEDHLRIMTEERDQLNASKDRLQGQLLDLRQALDSERESWEDKEKDYLQKIDEITSNHLKSVDQEKRKTALAVQTLEDTEGVLSTIQNEMSRLSMQLDAAHREKESLKVEMGIQEARSESARRKLEADLRADYEKQMSHKLSDAHKRQAKSEEEMRERHRRQVVELNARHTSEMEELNKRYQEDVRNKDDAIRQQNLEFEEKLMEATDEMEALQSEVRKLEGQRQDITSKLQEMMQSHCSEALRLLQLGPVTSSAGQTLFYGADASDKSAQFGMQTTSVSLPMTETSSSTPTNVASSLGKSSEKERTTEVPAWNSSALTYHSTGNSFGEAHHVSDEKDKSYPGVHIQENSVSQDSSGSQGPPTSRFFQQAPVAPVPQNDHYNLFGSSNVYQTSNSSNHIIPNEYQGSAFSQYDQSFDSHAPVMSASKLFEYQALPTSDKSGSFDYASQLTSKYSQPFTFQAPPTSIQTPPPDFQSDFDRVVEMSINDRKKSSEYQAPPTHKQSAEVGIARDPYKKNHAHQELQLSYREDATKSYLYDPTHPSADSAHQAMPPPMYTSSPPRGRGYVSKPLPPTSGSTQGSNFLRQLVEDAEEGEFQVLREDTTIESNTEDTESQASPRKEENVSTSDDKENPMPGDISGISDRFHEHQNRQAELQHYIRMLLQRSPGSVPPVAEEQRSFEEEPTRDISLGNIYSPIRIPQPDPVIMSGQGQEEIKRSAFEKKPITAKDLPPVSGLSPKQVGEIAKLIGQYHGNPQGGQTQNFNENAPSAVQHLQLRNLHQSEESTSSSERSPPQTVINKKSNISSKEPLTKDRVKKNLGVTFNEAAKERPSRQGPVTKSSSAKQQQGSAASRGPGKKTMAKNRLEEKKQIIKERKAAKVWK